MQQIQDGVFDGFSDSQLTSALNSLALYSNPKITSDALTAYNVEGQGVKMVGKWSIETPQGVRQVFGYRDENGIPTPIDPETSTKVKELEGISSSNRRVTDIMIYLATAGKLGARDEKGELIEGFVTDANEAWTGLPEEKQLEVATAIDVRAEFYRKRKGMNQLQAQRTAIKEIFTDNVEELGLFDFNDTVLNLGKFETEIAKEFINPAVGGGLTGTFQGTTNSGIDTQFSVKKRQRPTLMIEAKANGMVFTFPNETSQEVMLEMIDAYFGKEAPETQEQRAARGISDYSSPLSDERLQKERDIVSPEGKPWYAQPSAQVQSAKAVGDFFRYLGIGEGAETKSVEGVGKITRLDELGLSTRLRS